MGRGPSFRIDGAANAALVVDGAWELGTSLGCSTARFERRHCFEVRTELHDALPRAVLLELKGHAALVLKQGNVAPVEKRAACLLVHCFYCRQQSGVGCTHPSAVVFGLVLLSGTP